MLFVYQGRKRDKSLFLFPFVGGVEDLDCWALSLEMTVQ